MMYDNLLIFNGFVLWSHTQTHSNASQGKKGVARLRLTSLNKCKILTAQKQTQLCIGFLRFKWYQTQRCTEL